MTFKRLRSIRSVAAVIIAALAGPGALAFASSNGGAVGELAGPGDAGGLILATSNNAIRLRICTNLTTSGASRPNEFALEAHGRLLLCLPAFAANDANRPLPQGLTVNGQGPDSTGPECLPLLGRSSGPGWTFVRVNPGVAYRGRLQEYIRDYLVVEPDLVVVHDHVVAARPATLRWRLQVPPSTRIDPVWHDLHLETPQSSVTIHAPGRKGQLRGWAPLTNVFRGDDRGAIMELSPPNEAATELDVVLVIAVRPPGPPADYAFKLLESDTAVGARIHRDGYPTIVAFQVGQTLPTASLGGFKFPGLTGVDVFRPKPRPAR